MNEPKNEPPMVRKVDDVPAPAGGEPPLVSKVEEAQLAANVPRAPRKPAPGFWEALLWCVAFLACQFFALILVTGTVFAIFAFCAKDAKAFTDAQLEALKAATEPNPTGPASPLPEAIAESLGWGMIAAQVAALGMVLVVLPLRIGRGWMRQVGVRRPAGLHVLLVLLIVPGFVVLPDVVQSLFRWIPGMQSHGGEEVLRGVFGALPLSLTLLGVALGPGVVEEFWCRAFLGRGLCARYGVAAGVVVTSLLFAVMHMNPAQLPAYFCMGAFLHFVYFATRSVWAPVLLHAMNNGTAVVLALTLSPAKAEQPTPLVIPLAAMALLLFGGVALWTGRATVQPVSARPEPSDWKPEYPGISAPPAGTGLRVGHEAVSPVALIFTVVSFGAVIYLGYRFLS